MSSSCNRFVIALTAIFTVTGTGFALDSGIEKSLVEPLPSPIVVAGSRVGFTRDRLTGRINVHLDQLRPDHVPVLKKQRRLGTVFFSSPRNRITNDDLKLLMEVPLSGLVIANA